MMFDRFRARMGDRFSNVWVLLSDTDRFVYRSGLLRKYESQLKMWRSNLLLFKNDEEKRRRIRKEIVDFRRERRVEGWELRLGSLDVQLKGFRSDDAMAVGFRRLVLLAGDDGQVHFITGSGNHIELDQELSVRLRRLPLVETVRRHYLWYRRIEGVIELAGADSESKDSFELLKVYVDKHKSSLVRAMHGLR